MIPSLLENTDHAFILFDGVCNFCNSSVNFIIKRDKRDYFRFIPFQSELGNSICKELNISSENPESMVLIENKQVYYKSSAALKISRHLSGGWKLMYAFYIVPRVIRDWVYSLIGRNRYRIFGKSDSCMIPDAKVKAKFITE
jgi:predicted DCC family thiol-disulfide oxidoreductase YuxK